MKLKLITKENSEIERGSYQYLMTYQLLILRQIERITETVILFAVLGLCIQSLMALFQKHIV